MEGNGKRERGREVKEEGEEMEKGKDDGRKVRVAKLAEKEGEGGGEEAKEGWRKGGKDNRDLHQRNGERTRLLLSVCVWEGGRFIMREGREGNEEAHG